MVSRGYIYVYDLEGKHRVKLLVSGDAYPEGVAFRLAVFRNIWGDFYCKERGAMQWVSAWIFFEDMRSLLSTYRATIGDFPINDVHMIPFMGFEVHPEGYEIFNYEYEYHIYPHQNFIEAKWGVHRLFRGTIDNFIDSLLDEELKQFAQLIANKILEAGEVIKQIAKTIPK